MKFKSFAVGALVATAVSTMPLAATADDIVHDAEYYILKQQNGEKWAAEDKDLDAKLAEFKKKNGKMPPI